MDNYIIKIEENLFKNIKNINKPNILELGVQKGRSTLKFIEICKKQEGKLFSVDIDDCSNVSNDPVWKFIKTRDDNFDHIKNIIPEKLDVIFIDTLHEAKHVKKIIYNYYDLLKKGGFIFVDDISHLPYIENKKSSFYCEINNRETFNELLNIYYYNKNCFDLSFSFKSSGIATIKKISEDTLSNSKNIPSRQMSIKNLIRIIWKKISSK